MEDPEKTAPVAISPTRSVSVAPTPPLPFLPRLQRLNTRIESLSGFEARGITRVLPEERQAPSALGYLQMFLLWFSANITINNLAVGLLGPLLFQLGFVDSSLCAVFGAALGAVSTAYMSTWGAESGCRTMVVGRYFMGYYPSKICTLLNIILMLGYCTIDCIIGGQVLSAVSDGRMTIAVGVIVVAIVVLVIAVFGLQIFHLYERIAWIPQLLVLFILIGSAGPSFTTSLASTGSPRQIAANRLSFFSLCFYVPNSWAAAASDFYVYYPKDTKKWKAFCLTFAGLLCSFSLVNMLGVGLASGVATNPEWQAAYSVSSGALIIAGYSPLHGFGKFCAVVVALGVIANNVPGTYSAALGCQIMGRYGKVVPRWVWAVLLVLIQLICGLAGRNELFSIFQNFLALMGYWLMIMVCIVAEEHLLFRRPSLLSSSCSLSLGFDWSAWEDRKRLPLGIAACISFLLGWMGAILGMYQVWYVGPIAKLAGDSGADVGMWVGCGFALIAYPPLRWVEIKRFGK